MNLRIILKKVKSLLAKKEKMIPIPTITNQNEILAGKISLVTGGSSGIGFAIAQKFINSGSKVIIAGTNESKLKMCCEQLSHNGESCKYIVINMADITVFQEKIQSAAKLFEEDRIDILVNSAGVFDGTDYLQITESIFDNIMNVNLKGTYFMCQEVSKFMIAQQIKGHILNISSSSALRPAYSPYQLSKWSIRGLTLGLADVLLPYGIVVNAIAPGPTATPMLGKNEENIFNPNNPSHRYIMPNEIAELAVHMVSGLGDMIVGDTFYITGGSGTISLHR